MPIKGQCKAGLCGGGGNLCLDCGDDSTRTHHRQLLGFDMEDATPGELGEGIHRTSLSHLCNCI